MKEEVNKSIKSAWLKIIEIYKAVRIESALVFEINDEPILRIDTLALASIRSSTQDVSITLSGTKNSRKKRHSASANSLKQKSNVEAVTILANSIEKSATKLTNTILASKSQPAMTPRQSLTLSFPSIAPTNPTTTTFNGSQLVLAQRMIDLEIKLGTM